VGTHIAEPTVFILRCKPQRVEPPQMNVYLYACISSQDENRRTSIPLVTRLRRSVRRSIDWSWWRVTGEFRFAFYNYEDRIGNNLGDIAIRMAVREQLEQTFPPDGLRIRELGWGDLSETVLREINDQGDLFVIGGGGYIHCDTKGKLSRRLHEDIAYLERIQCPVVAGSIGINRNVKPGVEQAPPDEESRTLLRRYRAALRASSVRDPHSKEILDGIGAGGTALVADAALFLEAESKPPIEIPDGINVGLNFAFHGFPPQKLLRKDFGMYLDVLRRLRQQTGCRYYYFIHADPEHQVARLLLEAGLPITTISSGPRGLIAAYGRMSIHLSQMLHSAILSMNAGTPVFNSAYDVKAPSCYKLMGLEEYCVFADTLTSDQFLDAAMKLLANRDEVAGHLKRRKAELREEYGRFMATVARCAHEYASQPRQLISG
jgi:polysaccharide pyruvyl transferase WcaK-like protein